MEASHSRSSAALTNERPCGLMDKASDFGYEDCRFESCQGRQVRVLLELTDSAVKHTDPKENEKEGFQLGRVGFEVCAVPGTIVVNCCCAPLFVRGRLFREQSRFGSRDYTFEPSWGRIVSEWTISLLRRSLQTQ
ncbi:unnamed protein product [Toxocara canis]|uniref:Uncharacterized protein n=1 Tax=Toxocara canis TaxID=6265 RepID=A0A183TXV5_TOXCA|nr:unnamed protein product [Toxocara canis]